MPTEKICPICGESFKVPFQRPNQKYCSRDCAVIGRHTTKEQDAQKRVDLFIDRLPDIPILDVLEGRLESSSTNNRMTVTGARMWEGKKFIIIVTE